MSDSYTNVVSLSLQIYIGGSVLSSSSASFLEVEPSRRPICVFQKFMLGPQHRNHQPSDGVLHGGRDLSLASYDRCHAADAFSRAGQSSSDSRCPREAMIFQSYELTGTHLKPILSPVVPRE